MKWLIVEERKLKKNLGCNIFLHKVPIKYDMAQYNILISESQERMLIIANKDKVEEIFAIFDNWDLEYATIGETTLNGKYSVYNNSELLYTEKMSNYKDISEDWPLNLELDSDNLDIKKVRKMDLWKSYDSTVGNRTLKGPDKTS